MPFILTFQKKVS